MLIYHYISHRSTIICAAKLHRQIVCFWTKEENMNFEDENKLVNKSLPRMEGRSHIQDGRKLKHDQYIGWNVIFFFEEKWENLIK